MGRGRPRGGVGEKRVKQERIREKRGKDVGPMWKDFIKILISFCYVEMERPLVNCGVVTSGFSQTLQWL